MFKIKACLHNLRKILTQSLMTSFIGGLAILGTMVTEFSAVQAQEVNNQEVKNYAMAVLLIESHRQEALKNIQQIIGKDPPEIVCNQTETYKELPANAQEIAKQYCLTSEQIVENSGLTVSQFNDITKKVQSDLSLERRIQNAMLEIQQ